MLLFFSASAAASVLMDRVVAVVNKEVITWSELFSLMEVDASPQVKALNEEDRKKVFKDNEAAYLESLINIRLQMQEASRLGLGVSDAELTEAIENIKRKYALSDTDFKKSLKQEGYDFDDYKRRLREQIIINKITNHIIGSKIIVSDDDVKKHMNDNKGSIETAGSYRISQILIKKNGSAEEKSRADEKAAAIMRRLKNGENFSELARQNSEDPSASSGGDLGVIKKEYLSEEFIAVLAKMKTNEVSDPFWTDKGLHIIKLDEKIEYEDQGAMVEQIRKMLQNKAYDEKYNAWIKQLREQSFIEIRL